MTEGAFWNNWKGTAIPATGSTISKPNASGAYGGYKGSQSTSVAVDPFIADLLQMDSKELLEVSQLLKDAGYLRNTTKKYNKTLGDAYSRASMDWSNESARTGRQDLTFRAFLSENITTPSDASKKKGTQKFPRIDDDTAAEAKVAKAFEELGISPTPAQLKEWRKKLQEEQKKNPVINKYTSEGTQTTGGLDDAYWLTKNLSKTFKSVIEENKLKDPIIERRLASKKIYNQVTKGLTGKALDDAAAKTEYGRNLKETLNRIKEYALEAGAAINDEEANSLAQQLYDNNQEGDAATIRSLLRGKIAIGTGVLGGRAGTNLAELKKTATANGLDLTKAFGGQVQNWLQNIEAGESLETYKQIIRSVAKLGLPDKVGALVDQGIDLETIYTPYRRQMASLLELDEDAISLDDPLLRSSIGPDKEMSLFDFKKSIRKDPRWQYTDNAKEEVSSAVLGILRDFGFQG